MQSIDTFTVLSLVHYGILVWCMSDDISVFKSDEVDTCKQFGCYCEHNSVHCVDVPPEKLDMQLFTVTPHIHTIAFSDCYQSKFDLSVFSSIKSLQTIIIQNCGVKQVVAANITGLYNLNLQRNRISNWSEVFDLIRTISSLSVLDLSYNSFSTISKSNYTTGRVLRQLNLSNNQISKIEQLPDADHIDLSNNHLFLIDGNWPNNLLSLNLSNNRLLEHIPPLISSRLVDLNFNNCNLRNLSFLSLPQLRRFLLKNNQLKTIDFDALHMPSLHELDISNNRWLTTLQGMLPESVENFAVTNTHLSYFPTTFFSQSKKLIFAKFLPNNWSCDDCLRRWMDMLPKAVRPELNCSSVESTRCDIGISKRNSNNDKFIVRVPLKSIAVLPCYAYGLPAPSLEWWLINPKVHIGTYNPAKKQVVMNWTRNGSYEVLSGGSLMIIDINKYLVERYRCTAINSKGNASQIVHLRLDFSAWYHFAMTESVFWGSILAAFITCAVTFLLNIVWIVCRHVGLWWIKRLERASRVREMVTALVHYRERQMTALHDVYHNKIEQVRDNYHQQVEQLRTSYAYQAEKFRDYRTAQMESVNQHVESIRDNYNQQAVIFSRSFGVIKLLSSYLTLGHNAYRQTSEILFHPRILQMTRLREYGSRRVEQLWEGYERQANRIRAFTLQQRLCLMRKYKVKQQYLNRLFERFGDDQTHTFTKPHPEVILTDLPREFDVRMSHRANSFCSLPEYVLHSDDEGYNDDLLLELLRHGTSPTLKNDDVQCCSSRNRTLLSKQESVSLEHLLPVRRKHSSTTDNENRSESYLEREPSHIHDNS